MGDPAEVTSSGSRSATPAAGRWLAGEAVRLGHLVRQGLRVPPGFAVTTAAYREALAGQGRPVTVGGRLAGEIAAATGGWAATARRRWRSAPAPPPRTPPRRRSPASTTPSCGCGGRRRWPPTSPAAGRACSPRAVAYRARLGIPDDELAMGVVVQAVVPAEAARCCSPSTR